MSESERVLLVILCSFAGLTSVRAMWLEWRDPLRKRTPFEQRLIGDSMVGAARPKVVQTRLRTGPTAAVTFALIMVGADLSLLRVHGGAAVFAVYGAAALAGLIWMLVALFNRPRWAVPPALRNQPGMVHQRPPLPDPPYIDPRVPPEDRPKAS